MFRNFGLLVAVFLLAVLGSHVGQFLHKNLHPSQKPVLFAPSLWECEPTAVVGMKTCHRAVQTLDPRSGKYLLQVESCLVTGNKAVTQIFDKDFETLDNVDFGDRIEAVKTK